MGYFVIENFSAGVDRTRPIYALPPGTLWHGINGHISRGGDFEPRKAFVEKFALPTQTFGMREQGDNLYVFGSQETPALPTGVSYQRLEHPSGQLMTRLLATDLFDGKIYAIAKYIDDSIHHFYDGTRIADWDGGTGLPASKGTTALTLEGKVYSGAGSILYFSGLDLPAGWDSVNDAGSGFVNVANQKGGAESIKALAAYQRLLAVMSRKYTQLWDMQADDDNNVPTQTIRLGCVAPRAAIEYGDIDTFFLSDSGLRSLRARDVANTAAISDVGNPIDKLLVSELKTLSADVIEQAVAIVSPDEDRFLLALGEKVYVFSYFPGKKISAWTWYEPGFQITDFAAIGQKLYARSGDTIYLYGGDDGDTYDGSLVTLWVPFWSIKKHGTYKQLKGMDIAATGTWNARIYVDPNDLEQYVDVGDLEGFTFNKPDIAALGHVTHMSVRLTHDEADPDASVSMVGIHYEGAEDE